VDAAVENPAARVDGTALSVEIGLASVDGPKHQM